MGLFSNRVAKGSLKPGDHIYSWRAYVYAHHGIYVGDNKVIHFTRTQGQELGPGTAVDVLVSSTVKNRRPCCADCSRSLHDSHGVISTYLDCFLAGGVLYRFEYGVSSPLFLAKTRGGTCTLAESDPAEIVVHRATHLLTNGFRCYNVFKSNCEDFAIYCKTGLLVVEQGLIGQSGQAASIIGGPMATVFSSPIRLLTTSVYGWQLLLLEFTVLVDISRILVIGVIGGMRSRLLSRTWHPNLPLEELKLYRKRKTMVGVYCSLPFPRLSILYVIEVAGADSFIIDLLHGFMACFTDYFKFEFSQTFSTLQTG